MKKYIILAIAALFAAGSIDANPIEGYHERLVTYGLGLAMGSGILYCGLNELYNASLEAFYDNKFNPKRAPVVVGLLMVTGGAMIMGFHGAKIYNLLNA